MADFPYIGTPITGPGGTNDFEEKVNKGAPNGYAPLDANAKVPAVNLPDTASLDAEVDGKITTHNSATTSVHGIADTAELATKTYADDALFDHKDETTSIHGIVNTGELIQSTAIGPNTDKIVTFNQSGGGNGNEIVVSGIANAGDGYIAGIMGWGNVSGTQWSDLNGTYVKTSVAVTPSAYSSYAEGMHTPIAGTFNYYLQNPSSMGSPNSAYNGIAYFLAPNNRSGWGDPDDNNSTDSPVNYWRLCVISDHPYVYFTNPSSDPYTFPTSGWVPVSAQTDTPRQTIDFIGNYGGGFSASLGGGDNSEIGAWGFGVANGIGADAYIEPTGLTVEGSGKSVHVRNDKIELDNGAKLRKGTTDAGGNKGIALECTVHYELKWEAGRLYTMQNNGTTIRSVEHCMSEPTTTDDNTKGYVVGTRWVMDSGKTYVCTDVTEADAVWQLKFSQENNSGSINTSGGQYEIFESGAGGSIDLHGGDGATGGNIELIGGADNCSAGSIISNGGSGSSAIGGTLNMSGGSDSNGGSINTSGGVYDMDGGGINTSGGYNGAGGSINTSNMGGYINTSGDEAGAGGYINTSANNEAAGGYINTSWGGGNIDTSGIGTTLEGGKGGSINTKGSQSLLDNTIFYAGGDINTSAGQNGSGGIINTSNGGGSINTRGTGSIGLGVAGTRTTLNGSASGTDKTITLPNATGTIALTSHTHGNLTSDGKVGSTANLPLITTTAGAITTGSFGTTANSFCQGNDVRLSDNRTPTAHTHAIADVTGLQTALDGKQASGSYVLTTDARLGSQTIFTLGGEAKTTFVLGTSYLYGCMPTRGPQLSGSYTSAVLQVLGNFTVTGISIHQYLPSLTGATLTYQLVRVANASTVVALGSSVVVAGNNNLTTSINSISASLSSGDSIGLMLTLGASGTVPVATAATTILANIYCVPR